MSPVREKFVKVVESLPYNLEEEILKKNTYEILKDVTQRYVDTYGIDDLSFEDQDLIHNVLCDNYDMLKNKQDSDNLDDKSKENNEKGE